jgi:hypothetical protein
MRINLKIIIHLIINNLGFTYPLILFYFCRFTLKYLVNMFYSLNIFISSLIIEVKKTFSALKAITCKTKLAGSGFLFHLLFSGYIALDSQTLAIQ